jgi:hypothetical protein
LINKLRNHPTIQGSFFAIGATAIWSVTLIIARGLNDSIPPISLAFWRWTVAVLVAFVLWNKAIFAVGSSRAGMIYYSLDNKLRIGLELIGEKWTIFIPCKQSYNNSGNPKSKRLFTYQT